MGWSCKWLPIELLYYWMVLIAAERSRLSKGETYCILYTKAFALEILEIQYLFYLLELVEIWHLPYLLPYWLACCVSRTCGSCLSIGCPLSCVPLGHDLGRVVTSQRKRPRFRQSISRSHAQTAVLRGPVKKGKAPLVTKSPVLATETRSCVKLLPFIS